MPATEAPALALFKAKAAAVSARVVEVLNLDAAMAYALDICERKEACERLFTGAEAPCAPAASLDAQEAGKTFAAPGLTEKDLAVLEKQSAGKDLTLIKDNLRSCLYGIDVGFALAGLGIAETGTCVLASANEDVRLASMLCEISVIALPKSAVVASLYDAEEFMNGVMSQGVMYVSYISGPSRTADIERVLTLGVHGPLELHVALLEG